MAMKAPALQVGDMVRVHGMPESSNLNGTVGTLTKTIGAGRWALKVDGEERSKVVMQENLSKLESGAQQAEPGEKFSIVGTWDDWEPRQMLWSAEGMCFQHEVTLGHDGAESFKILLDADWDKCVYPDRKDACPHQAHQIKGPDDGGLDEEWTIGLHEADEGATGDVYRVKFFITAEGRPRRVTWEKISGQGPAPLRPVGSAEEAKAPPPAPRTRGFSSRAPAPPTVEEVPRTFGGQAASRHWEENSAERVVAEEKAARERLAKRLEDAAQLGMGMIPIRDAGEEEEDPYRSERIQAIMEREAEERDLQKDHNKERFRKELEETVRERAAMTKGTSRMSGICAECGTATNNMYGQIYVREECLAKWEQLKEEGWDGNALCGGVPAAMRAQQVHQSSKGQMTMMQARRQVMREYAPSFRQY